MTNNEGDTAYASKAVHITGPPKVVPVALGPLQSFKLSNPGVRRAQGQGARDPLPAARASRVTLSLYRGKKRVKRLASGAKKASRTYKIRSSRRQDKRDLHGADHRAADRGRQDAERASVVEAALDRNAAQGGSGSEPPCR